MVKSFRDRIIPDKFNLDEEWAEQGSFFNEYGRLRDDARLKEDKAKENLAVVDAEIDLDVRTNWKEKYKLDKLVEGTIKSLVAIDPAHKTAMNAYLEARHEHDILKTAMGTISQKHDALQDLTKIWIKGYYSESIPVEGATNERVAELKQETVKQRKRVRRLKNTDE